MSSALRSTATAVTAVLTALTLTACTTGDNAGTEVSFQFHSPGGETEILYEEDQRAPLPDFSGPSLMEEGETINLSDFEDEIVVRSEEHTSELQSRFDLVCRLLLEKKKNKEQ